MLEYKKAWQIHTGQGWQQTACWCKSMAQHNILSLALCSQLLFKYIVTTAAQAIALVTVQDNPLSCAQWQQKKMYNQGEKVMYQHYGNWNAQTHT